MRCSTFVGRGLHDQVHTNHPRYFGLFNPAPTTLGIAADTLVAAFNPQLAAWSHAPFANEVERHVVLALAARFGMDPDSAHGALCSGGAEANHTAVLCALTHTFADFAARGLRALPAQPRIYVTGESHHSLVKAARFCGLGTDALSEVPVDAQLRMDVAALDRQRARRSRRRGCPVPGGEHRRHYQRRRHRSDRTHCRGRVAPRAVASPGRRLGRRRRPGARTARRAGRLRARRLHHVRRAQVAVGAHGRRTVPHAPPGHPGRTCAVDTDYMPRDAARHAVRDPFAHSLQWSRRFAGLKIFMSLAAAGFDGYAQALRNQVAMAERLRERLEASGWQIENRTPLPVVCFAHPDLPRDNLAAIAQSVVGNGEAWVSVTRLPPGRDVLRACITNFQTAADDVDACVDALDRAAARLAAG